MRRSTPGSGGHRDAGQTQLDFLVGIVFFLLVVVVALSTVPTLLTPFVAGQGSTDLPAESVATQLSSGVLTTPEERYVLDPSKVEPFFDGDADTVHDAVSLDDSIHVRVSLTGPTVDESVGRALPGETTARSLARRTVRYRGERATLEVVVWR